MNHPLTEQVEAYVDGRLSSVDAAAFEQARQASPELAEQVALARAIESSLRRRFSGVPDAAAILAHAQRAAAPAASVKPSGRTLRLVPLARAAAIGLVLVGVTQLVLPMFYVDSVGVNPSRITSPYKPQQTIEQVYADAAARNFAPDWVCESRKEFIWTFSYRLGQGMALVAELPPALKMSGLCYANVMSRDTVYMIGTVDGTPVLIFVDRMDKPAPADPAPPLHLYRGQLGALKLYEMSPLDRPYFLDQFERRELDEKSGEEVAASQPAGG
jgi:hypothetical protein